MGMVHDAKHAIVWIKANAAAYGINPANIVIGSGSAGTHIALLAGYTCRDKLFIPQDLECRSWRQRSNLMVWPARFGSHLLSYLPDWLLYQEEVQVKFLALTPCFPNLAMCTRIALRH